MPNRILLISFLAACVLFCQCAYAQSTDGGVVGKNMLGIRLSTADAVVNNSITYKRFINSTLAVEGLLTIADPAAIGVLLQKHTALNATGLSWFWGAGVYAAFGGGRRFGAQGAAGLDFTFPTLPVNLSVDWKPELNFSRQFSFEPSAIGVSARFVF